MHLMHETEEDTVVTTEQVRATFGPPRTVSRKPRVDAALADAVDIARSALADFADEAEIGDHIGVVADDERVVTHRFASKVRGYGGWEFFTTLARAPRSKSVTVCETGMLPGDDARSEEHTSELQSRGHLVCRLLLQKKNISGAV